MPASNGHPDLLVGAILRITTICICCSGRPTEHRRHNIDNLAAAGLERTNAPYTGSAKSSPVYIEPVCPDDAAIENAVVQLQFAEDRARYGLLANMKRDIHPNFFNPHYVGLLSPAAAHWGSDSQERDSSTTHKADTATKTTRPGMRQRRTRAVINSTPSPHTSTNTNTSRSPLTTPRPLVRDSDMCTSATSRLTGYQRLHKTALVMSVLPEMILTLVGRLETPGENRVIASTLLPREECFEYLSGGTIVQINAFDMDRSDLIGEYRLSLSEIDRLVDFVGRSYILERNRESEKASIKLVIASSFTGLPDQTSYPPYLSWLLSRFRRMSLPDANALREGEFNRIWCNRLTISRKHVWSLADWMKLRVDAVDFSAEGCSPENERPHFITSIGRHGALIRLAHEVGYHVNPRVYAPRWYWEWATRGSDPCALHLGPSQLEAAARVKQIERARGVEDGLSNHARERRDPTKKNGVPASQNGESIRNNTGSRGPLPSHHFDPSRDLNSDPRRTHRLLFGYLRRTWDAFMTGLELGLPVLRLVLCGHLHNPEEREGRMSFVCSVTEVRVNEVQPVSISSTGSSATSTSATTSIPRSTSTRVDGKRNWKGPDSRLIGPWRAAQGSQDKGTANPTSDQSVTSAPPVSLTSPSTTRSLRTTMPGRATRRPGWAYIPRSGAPILLSTPGT